MQPTSLAEDKPAAPAHEVYRERLREQRREKSRLAAVLSWLVTGAIFAGATVAAFFFRNDVVKVWPQSAAAYKLAGLDVNRFGLDFADIERARTFNDTIPIVTVTGRAVNVARTQVETPGVRVDLRDEAGKVVATEYSFVTPGTLEPGGSGQFGVVVEPAPVESFEIVVSFVERSAVPDEPPVVETAPLLDDVQPEPEDPV
ncbi:FxLYD domain-containing protein [Hyphomonas sp.]|uniref:FxLYD domain-containing protein n=1 Tax=Hyphomonas sp. TaxID=87 RepID=UPI00391CFB27